MIKMRKSWYEKVQQELCENVPFEFGIQNWKVQEKIKLVIFPYLTSKKNITIDDIYNLLKKIPCLNNENENNLRQIAHMIMDSIELYKYIFN